MFFILCVDDLAGNMLFSFMFETLSSTFYKINFFFLKIKIDRIELDCIQTQEFSDESEWIGLKINLVRT